MFRGTLGQRERLIAKLAILAGMRPGEIFAVTWGRLTATHADIMQRIYRRKLDTPKTDNSTRHAALSEGRLADIEAWRTVAVSPKDDSWVFPSERMTPLSNDNCWRRSMLPKLELVGLAWRNFSGDAADARDADAPVEGRSETSRRSTSPHG